MKFSENFRLAKSQGELDFVDIELDSDTALFVDPYALSTGIDDFSVSCGAAVNSFFQSTINAIRAGRLELAAQLFSQLHEPNETRLGLSAGRPSGRGIGGLQAGQLLRALSASTAVQTGFVEDLADCELLVDGIGPDKISDITTNVIRSNLISYTQDQCRLLNVPMRRVASGPVWTPERGEWSQRYEDLPVVNDSKVILVPKRAVRWRVLLEHREYYNKFVLEYLQAHADKIIGLAHLARGKNGKVPKKILAEEYPLTKKFLLDFSRDHRDVFDDYKASKVDGGAISNEELDSEFDPIDLAQHLIAQLRATPSGRADATRFHHLCAGIISFLFYPNLITPKLEDPINDDRKRIDVTYVNTAHSGIFARFTPTYRRTSGKIIVEFKNYAEDPNNPEVDQLLGRFADHRGWLGMLVCRTIVNRRLLETRCRDIARDHGGYIVVLDDSDMIAMLEASIRGESQAIDEYFGARFNALTR